MPSLLKDKQQNVLKDLWEKVKVDDLKINLETYKKLLNDPCDLIIDTCLDERGNQIIKISAVERFSNAFNYIVKVYYGLNNLNIADEVFQSILKCIKDNYPDMTFSNLNLCFVNGVEKKQGISLTRDEFMQPIHYFMAKKKRIESLLQDIQLKEYNERIEIENANKFVEHSMEIYNNSIGQVAFLGTPFEANSIVEQFIEQLNEIEINECKYRSSKLFSEQKETGDFYAIIPERHLFAKEVMDLLIFKNK